MLISVQGAFAQYGKVQVSNPPYVINQGGEYSTLGSQRSYLIGGAREYYFYKSDEFGVVPKRRFRLDGWAATDSLYAIANLPSGWLYSEPPCNPIDGLLLANWDLTGDDFKLRYFNGNWWITQVASESPDAFVVRGIDMLERSDMTIINELSSNCINIAPSSGLGGLYEPDGFSTPSGYESYFASDGTTKIYTNGSVPNDGGGSGGSGGESGTASESFANPIADVNYDASGNISNTRQSFGVVESGSTRTLNDSNWANGFCSSCGTRYVHFGNMEYSAAQNTSLSNLDVSDLAGFDLAPITSYGKDENTDDYSQSLVHIKADSGKPRRTYITGDYTYRWMPEEYVFESGFYPSYKDYFPDFTLPSGKIAATQLEFGDDYPSYTSNDKGWTFTKTMEYNNSHYYDYDGWATSAGMPAAYSVDDATRNLAFDNIAESTLISNFTNEVYSNRNRGMVVLNFEVFVGLDKNKQKLSNIFNVWKNGNPDALLAFWTEKGAIKTNRIQFESVTDINQIAPDIDYTGDYSSWGSTRANSTIFLRNYGFNSYYPDVFYVNDLYQTELDNLGWIHEAVANTVMNRKFYPDKKSMWIDFPSVENQVNITTANVAYIEHKSPTDGQVYKFKEKPIVAPADMWSRALFAYAFADGMELWWDRHPLIDDPYWYGSKNGETKDQNDNVLTTNRYKTYSDGRDAGRFIGRSMKAVDWHVAAAYAVSQNKDIIESNTEWRFLEYSMDNGSTWRTGSQGTIFATSAVNKELIPLYKEKADGTAGLVLIYNPSQSAVAEQTYKVRINGVEHSLFQVGHYASIVRVALNNTAVAPTDPGDNYTSIGDAGYSYGSDYATLRNEVSSGVGRFNYYGNPSPDNNYPAPNPSSNTGGWAPYNDDYVLFNFPSHSTNYTSDGLIGKVAYQVFDNLGNLVLEMYDTKGGIYGGARANNHPDDCKRWIKRGTYRIKVWNISTDDRDIHFRIGTTARESIDGMAVDIEQGDSYEYTYDFQLAEGSVWHNYKMNINAY